MLPKLSKFKKCLCTIQRSRSWDARRSLRDASILHSAYGNDSQREDCVHPLKHCPHTQRFSLVVIPKGQGKLCNPAATKGHACTDKMFHQDNYETPIYRPATVHPVVLDRLKSLQPHFPCSSFISFLCSCHSCLTKKHPLYGLLTSFPMPEGLSVAGLPLPVRGDGRCMYQHCFQQSFMTTQQVSDSFDGPKGTTHRSSLASVIVGTGCTIGGPSAKDSWKKPQWRRLISYDFYGVTA